MITLTIFVYLSFAGEAEWNSDIALGLAAFDLLMASTLANATLFEIKG